MRQKKRKRDAGRNRVPFPNHNISPDRPALNVSGLNVNSRRSVVAVRGAVGILPPLCTGLLRPGLVLRPSLCTGLGGPGCVVVSNSVNRHKTPLDKMVHFPLYMHRQIQPEL